MTDVASGWDVWSLTHVANPCPSGPVQAPTCVAPTGPTRRGESAWDFRARLPTPTWTCEGDAEWDRAPDGTRSDWEPSWAIAAGRRGLVSRPWAMCRGRTWPRVDEL